MVDLYKQPEQPLPKLDNFKSFDVNGQEVTNVIPENNELYNLPPDQQEAALAELQKPPTGEELAYALAQNPNFEKAMTLEEFKTYDDYMKTVETDWIEGIMTGAGMVVDEIGNGLSAMYNDDEKLKRAIPTLAEGFARGTRDMYGLVAQSADPQSPFFKFKELLTGSGSPEERFQQFKEARDFNRRSMEIMEGKANVTDIDPDLINPQVAQALSYVADPSWALPFVGQAGKAMGISMKSIGLAKLSEQIAVVGAMTEHAKRLAFGGLLKVAGAPLNLLGNATMRTIEWGAERATGAFEFATGMAYQDARRIVRDAGLYGGTIFRVPYMSTISDSYIAGFGAKGLGEAMDIMGDVIMGRKRGVYSYAEEALAAGKDVLSPQAKAMLRILNQADPILSYGYAAVEGMTEGALVGAALGYGSARGEGAAQGIGMGAAMGAGGALMGRAWAGMAREGGIIHQRVLTELEFVKNAMKDVDPDKLAQINTLQELAALHGQDLSWQILGILKLAPDLKIEVLDSIGFEQQRRKNRGPMKEGEVDPLFGLDLDDPNDIKKVRQFYNFEGMVVQRGAGGEVTLFVNADHYKKYTFGHEMFHGIMRSSVMGEEFIKDLREKLMGRVTENGVELPGVIEPSKMRSFMERYIKAAYSNNPEQRDARLRALDTAIKAYEADGTLIPGQDDARPVLDNLVEEAGAYYFSHMIEGRDMDWLYRGGDLGGIRQVIADAKEGIRDFIEAKFGSAGMDFKAASTLHEAFLKGGKEGGSRIRIGALDALMQDIVRRQAGSQEGRVIDFGDMTGDQQRRFRDRNGLGDVLQPRKNGGMDARKRTAAEESARAKQIVDTLRAMNDADRTSTTVVEKNGDVTIYGNLSDAELNQLVRVGAMLPTEASRYRMFRDVIANKGNGTNVFGAVLVGESFEVGEGRNPRRLRRSKGDKVPTTNREFMPIEMRTEIRLTKGGKGKATFVVTGLDIKNADMRLRELWHREDVQKSWGGDYNAFAADFYMYLQNASDPNGIPSAEYFGGGQQGSYKRNVFHEAFGAAMKDGESPFNEPSPTYKGSAGRGEKFVIYSMTLGSMYDVKMRDRNVPYNHSIAYDRIRRNWSPSEMRQEVLPDGEKLTHEMSGYSFIKGPNGKWRAYDNFRRVVGIAENAATATEIGRKAYNAEQARVAKEVKNFSVNEKTDITAKGWAPAFFSAVEKFVKSGAITPNMHPEQVWARISKASFAGIRADELKYLGLKERILGKDNAHLQNAREMDKKVQELFTYSQRFASQDPAKLARVQEVAANLRKAQQEEYKKGVEMQRKEQAADSLAIGKPIGQEGLDVINKHLQERAFGLRMTEEGTSYSGFVMDGIAEHDSYVILTARSNQRTGVSGHFGDDVIVHIRVDIRTDPKTGERVLVVHEIQANNAEQRGSQSNTSAIQVRVDKIKRDIETVKQRLKPYIEYTHDNSTALEVLNAVLPDVNLYRAVTGETRSHASNIASSRYYHAEQAVALDNAQLLLRYIKEKKDKSLSKRFLRNMDVVDEKSIVKTNVDEEFSVTGNKLLFEINDEFYAHLESSLGKIRKKIELLNEKLAAGRDIHDVIAEDMGVGTYPDLLDVRIKSSYLHLVGHTEHNSGFTSLSKLADHKAGQRASATLQSEFAYMGLALAEAYRTASPELKKSLFKLVDKDGNAVPLSDVDVSNRLMNLFKSVYDSQMMRDAGTNTMNIRNVGSSFNGLVRDLILPLPETVKEHMATESLPRDLRAIIEKRYQRHAERCVIDVLRAINTNPEHVESPVFKYLVSDPDAYKQQFAKALEAIRNPDELDSYKLSQISRALEKYQYAVILGVNEHLEQRTAKLDLETSLEQEQLKLKQTKSELIAQTPQDWIPIGLKMAIRYAAERDINTILFTDHTGAPSKCGMDYESSGKLYIDLVPSIGNGFLRQYNTKIEMPVLPKVYKFNGIKGGGDRGEPVVIGHNNGVSWQEQLGMTPSFKAARNRDGSINYRVQYEQSYGRGVLSSSGLGHITQQDVHAAQMRNNPRMKISPELKGIALNDGFRNLSPSEGGEVPPMPRSEEGRRRDAAPRTLNVFPKDREFKRWAGKLLLVSLDGIRHMTAPDNKFDVDSREAYHMLKNGFVVTAFHGTPERSHESFENRTYEGTYFVPDEKAAAEYARIFAVDAQAKKVLSKGRDAAYADERTRKFYDTWPKEKGKPGLDAYTFGKPDMYYLRSERPIVALDIRTGVAENRKIKKVIDRLVRDALDNKNPTRAEYRDKFEEIISRIEAADMYDINGGGYDSIQNTFVEYAFQEGFDSAVFFDTSIDSYAPTIVMNNAKQSNVKAASNIGAFSEDARFDYSPSEKPIEEFGKESFVTGKKKFEKAIGMYFRERGTGRVFVMEHTSNDASYAYFYPVDLRNEEAALGDNPTPEQSEAIRQRILAERKVIKHDQGMGGLGYRGIDDKVIAAFESYSKTEPGKGAEGAIEAPSIDTSALKTNGEAIKDALTSLDGLALTKDQTFQLFGRNTKKGREPGIIDNINSEISKVQRGEEPNIDAIESHLEELETLRDELQEKQENTPENFQDSEAYQNREEVIDAMTETLDEVRGLMEPPKGGGETRNMFVAENIGDGEVKFGGEYKGVTSLLSNLELWALAAKAGKLSKEAKLNHKNVSPEAIKTIEWLLTNDNSGATAGRPNFTTEHEAMKWVQKTALSQYKGYGSRYLPDSYKKTMKQAYLAASSVLETKKPKKTPTSEPKAKDGASFDDWYDWARKKRVNGKNVATAHNALKFITEMPGEGYFKAVAQMLLAMGNVPFLDMNLNKTQRGFMGTTSQGDVRKIAISTSGGGMSDTGVSMAGRIDTHIDSTVSTVIEEVMHAAQLTNANYAPWVILKKNLGMRGVEWKKNALKLIADVEGEIKGKSHDALSADTKNRLIAARIAKLILEGTKGITALSKDGKRGFDLHQALFTDVAQPGGIWRAEGDPSKGGGAGARLRFEYKLKDGTKKAETGYHFGNVAEFLVGIFSDPHLAQFYFDKPPVDLSSLTPKGEPLRTSWRNLASQMISVAIDFFTGLFKGEKKNLGSQFIEETVVLLQRQAENYGNKEPANQIDTTISTNEVGFPEKPMKKPVGLRGKAPLPSEGPINMGVNEGEAGLATVPGESARSASEVGPATQVVDGEAKPIPRQGRPTPRIGMEDKNLPAQRYYYPPSAKSVSITPIWSTGDAMAGRSILTSTAGYMVMLINGKWRVYNPEKEIIGVFNDEQKAKDLADRRAMRK